MSESVAIRVERLSKRFRLGSHAAPDRFTERLQAAGWACIRRPWQWLRGASAPREAATNRRDEHWALDDVSFEVQRGEALGIVGRNGAGKSTLLKILTRITEPTSGRFGIRGRVASLLEVGTGFHPDLTGRENIYLSGAFLGLSRQEIRRRFDEIVAFAEIDAFIDTPVKRYSSGMYTRLGFAVAAHLESEVLIVDEVLAVGDAAFQKKCLGKMHDSALHGRTVLFVSHNMLAVRSLCRRAACFDRGHLTHFGNANEVVLQYQGEASKSIRQCRWDNVDEAPGNDETRLHAVTIRSLATEGAANLTEDDEIECEFAFWNLVDNVRLNPSVVLYNGDGVPVFNTYPAPGDPWLERSWPRGLYRSAFRIPARLLTAGEYRLQLYIIRDAFHCVYRFDDAGRFSIHEGQRESSWWGPRVGIVSPTLAWNTELIG